MPLYVAEYAQPVANPTQLRRCLDVREVRWLHRWTSEQRELAVFEAESAERVRDAHRSADVSFAAVWKASEAPIPP